MKRIHFAKRKFHLSFSIGFIGFVLFLILFLLAVSNAGSESIERQEEALNNAMERDIIHCYALEGFYPPSLDYLVEHYGLTYDTSEFMVDYQPIASNIHPDFTIIRKEE